MKYNKYKLTAIIDAKSVDEAIRIALKKRKFHIFTVEIIHEE